MSSVLLGKKESKVDIHEERCEKCGNVSPHTAMHGTKFVCWDCHDEQWLDELEELDLLEEIYNE